MWKQTSSNSFKNKITDKLCANKWLILNYDCYIAIVETIQLCAKKKMRSGSFKNFIYIMCLQIIYVQYIWKTGFGIKQSTIVDIPWNSSKPNYIYIYTYIYTHTYLLLSLSLSHIYIYIYIYDIHRQTVSPYHNSAVWLDMGDDPSWDQNPLNFTSGWWHTLKPRLRLNVSLGINTYVLTFVCLHFAIEY